MVIVVFSCDKNKDLWFPFYHCIEKYYPNHPEIIYKTEKLKNPYYKTISKNYPLDKWTLGIKEALEEIEDDLILFLADDIFIRKPVDIDRINYCIEIMQKYPIACMNFEKSFDKHDIETNIKGFKKRQKGSRYEMSIMCGLWDRKTLIDVMNCEKSPWELEDTYKNTKYNFYINSGEYIIDWGYSYLNYAGIQKGKWCKEAKYFFDNEGIKIDYDKRGFANDNYTPL